MYNTFDGWYDRREDDLRLQVTRLGLVRQLDGLPVLEGTLRLQAYSADERLIAVRLDGPARYRGVPLDEWAPPTGRVLVLRVVAVSETDVVTVVFPPALEWEVRAGKPQFGPWPE